MYNVLVVCSNCGYHGNLDIPVGQTINSQYCPVCVCQELRRQYGATAHDSERKIEDWRDYEQGDLSPCIVENIKAKN